MVNRVWHGKNDDWYTAADWASLTGDGYPLPGDTVTVASGDPHLIGAEAKDSHVFDDQIITLGSAGTTATLSLDDAVIGRFFSVTLAGSGLIQSAGRSGYAGSITAAFAGTTLTLSSVADASGTAGNFVLLNGGQLSVTGGARLDLEGVVTVERSVTLAAADPLVNNASVAVLAGLFDVQSSQFLGTGAFAIGVASTVFFESAVPKTQTVSFTGGDGRLELSDPGQFAGHIENFAPQSVIDLIGTNADAASYSLATHTITLSRQGASVLTLHDVDGVAGALAVTPVTGGERITYAATATRLTAELGAAAHAERADVAHAMTVPGTVTPITGAGIRIGILSDSFDLVRPGSANADAALGYLPADANGLSAVHVLKEGPAGSVDEGRAMAELVHQIAPGAQIDFYTAADGVDDFASGITALANAGDKVILDDFAFRGAEPFYQVAGPADTAIANAVAAGVSYFTLATNFGQAYYEHAFSPASAMLYDGSSEQAMLFSNGTPYQSITVPAGTAAQIDLQWDAPFYGTGNGANQPDSVSFKAFDSSNHLVGTSTQRLLNGQFVAESEMTLSTPMTDTNYQVAIYQNGGTPIASQVKYILFGKPAGAQSPGGVINDPDAGKGSGLVSGHALAPGAITVAATYVANAPAFGQPADFLESFSSSGPGELLFDADGNRLAQPQVLDKVNVTGADGIYTSVPGFAPFYGTSAATPDVGAIAALLLQADPSITPAQIASVLEQSALPMGLDPAWSGSGLVQADQAVLLAEQLACFAEGTNIATAHGPVAVEALAIGDMCLTMDGAAPVTWIGRRAIICSDSARPHETWPVRIQAGAFGITLPLRDLYLSPDHAVFAEGALIPVCLLVNGTTVAPHPVEQVTYYHVELPDHRVMLAEGLPVESYRDTGSRRTFAASNSISDQARFASNSIVAAPPVQRSPASGG